MQINFLQPVLIIFTRGAINSDHDCIYIFYKIYRVWIDFWVLQNYGRSFNF